ncbi:hypothetical protein SAMN05216188_12175 [Lentzea xinjiangensis]|uniref:Uncharacterized protein n=1 Tax=Lentzea xinjiangensis TaxID=402600 RepID=A0A1H9UEK8_9PSEU|nr:hypothetical protein [Lentzea xinjiangensis]SES08000.1 hypothetical protein SAMN05216188_12175 [Lentzea xinjiangensis]
MAGGLVLKYLEPRTDVPAKDDWSTRLALAEARIGLEQRLITVVTALTFVATFFLPATPGNTAARIVLGVHVLLALPLLLVHRSERRMLRRGLLDEPWRRVPADVAQRPENDYADRLLLGGLVLKGAFNDLADVVRSRREVFVCGPDARGRAVVRGAGSTSMYPAEVDEGEYSPAPPADSEPGRPRDDERLRDGLRLTGSFVHLSCVLTVLGVVVIGVLVALSVSPLAPAGLIAAALLMPGLSPFKVAEAVRRQRHLVRAVAESEEWTPVPTELLPWRRGHHVAGIADLPGGRALVRFPRPSPDLVANIAGTGVMWVAGTHRDTAAVGVPGRRELMSAVVLPDRAASPGDPMPWWRRLRQTDFSDLPT